MTYAKYAKMENLEQLRLFLTVVRGGSFSAAARELDLAPSSVSRQITELEKALDTRLFTRTTRQLALTDAGDLLTRRARQLLSDVDETRRELSELDEAPSGTLRLTAPIAFGRAHVGPVVISFLEEYPELNVELGLTDRTVDLVQEGLDAAIRIGSLPDSSLVARHLAPMHRQLYASPDYLKKAGTPVTPDDLSQHDCLTFRIGDTANLWRPGGDVWRLEGPEGLFTTGVSGPLVATSADVLVQAAVSGLGIILVIDWLVQQELAQGTLVPVMTDYAVSVEGPAGAIYAVYPSGRFAPARLRAFIEHAQTHLGQPEVEA